MRDKGSRKFQNPEKLRKEQREFWGYGSEMVQSQGLEG